MTSLTETYEGNDGTPDPITMTTRATTAPVTFTMALNPSNDGAVLLRTSDQANGYQSVAVSVNGQQLAQLGAAAEQPVPPVARRHVPTTGIADRRATRPSPSP